jgi:hypothetical protein
MAAPLSVCTKAEQRSVTRFLWSEDVSGAEMHPVFCRNVVSTNGLKNSKMVAQVLRMKKEPDARPRAQLKTALSAYVMWF